MSVHYVKLKLMWRCPICERKFNAPDQRHSCSTKDVGELFINRSDELVLAYDALSRAVEDWPNVEIRAAIHSVVFSVGRAFLVVKPMKSQLDLKLYHNDEFESNLFHKVNRFYGRFQYQIRIQSEHDINEELLHFITKSYEHAQQERVVDFRRRRKRY